MTNGCCHSSNGSANAAKTNCADSASVPSSAPGIWIKALVAVFVANLAVMIVFTFSVNGKLNEAIDLAKPVEGTLTTITSSACPLCRDFSPQAEKVKSMNTDIQEEKSLDADSAEGKELIGKLEIKNLPAIVFSAKERIKTGARNALEKNGRSVGEKIIVWEQNAPPYFDVASSQTRGLVTAMILTDSSCAKCTDIKNMLMPMLARMGMTPSEESTADIGNPEGDELADKYKIIAVPTVILSPETGDYQTIASTWPQVGTVEEDGSYVLRNLAAIRAVYRDLETGKVVGEKKE